MKLLILTFPIIDFVLQPFEQTVTGTTRSHTNKSTCTETEEKLESVIIPTKPCLSAKYAKGSDHQMAWQTFDRPHSDTFALMHLNQKGRNFL